MSIAGSIIVPHPPIIVSDVGRGREQELQKTIDAYRTAAQQVRAWEPEVLLITSPHAVVYPDYFHLYSGLEAAGDLAGFGAPQIRLETKYDGKLRDAVSRWARDVYIPTGTLGQPDPTLDYGTLIPLYFLREAGVNCPILRIGQSGLSPLQHYRLGECIANAVNALNRRAVFVASGNLSHKPKEGASCGFAPEGPEFDQQVTAAMASGDFLRFLTMDLGFCARAAECGLRSFQIMAGALDGLAAEPELLSYEAPLGVGCAVAVFTVTGTDKNRRFAAQYETAERRRITKIKTAEDPWVQLARLSAETYIRTGQQLNALPKNLPAEMIHNSAGVFVSIYIQGQLRGCVGTPYPRADNVAWEIVQNAIAASNRDPRFSPVTVTELDRLEYRVDVLGEFEEIDSPAELDVHKYGVGIFCGLRTGLMLPDSRDVDTVELQIALALHHGGIDAKEPYTMKRFEVVRHT